MEEVWYSFSVGAGNPQIATRKEANGMPELQINEQPEWADAGKMTVKGLLNGKSVSKAFNGVNTYRLGASNETDPVKVFGQKVVACTILTGTECVVTSNYSASLQDD